MRQAGPRARSGGVPHDLQPYLEPLEADTAETSQSVNEDLLEMGNLLMMQFYHLHTAKKMSTDPKRGRVWQRVIRTSPEEIVILCTCSSLWVVYT